MLELHSEVVGRRLTTVIAGPGFGKSTLIRGWAGHEGSLCELGPKDAELSSFGNKLKQSLEGRIPKLSTLGSPATSPGEDGKESADALAIAICEALYNSSSDTLLLIDDVQELGSLAARLSGSFQP